MKLTDSVTSHIYIRVTDMKDCSVDMSDLKYITDEIYDVIKNYTISANDLYITIAGSIGRVGEIPKELHNAILTENAAKLTNIICDKKFLMYALLSDIAQSHFTSRFHQVAQPKLSIETASCTLIPLPPLNEQARIVNVIDHFLAIIKDINKSTDELSSAISQVKSKILELAISGKLVPQDLADEPAADLLQRVNPNAVVSADTSHYSIPSTWIWVKLSDIFEINPKNHNNDDEDDCGFVPMSYVQDGYSGEHTFEVRKWGKVKKGYSHFQNGDIGVAKISPCFENLKSTIFHSLPNNIGAGTTELVIMRGKEIFAPFFLYLFKSPWYISKGTVYFKGVVGQQRVSRDIFTSLEVPLPPLNEQKRITAKVDELFAVIDQIQQSLE